MSAHGPWDEGGQAPILPVLGPASSGGAHQVDPEWEGEDDFFGQALEYEERLAQERAAAEAAREQQAAYEAHWRNTAVALLHAPIMRGKALSVQEFAVVTDAVAQVLAQGMVPINEEGDNCSEASWDASSIASGFPMMGPPTDGGAAPGSAAAAAGGAAARGGAPSAQGGQAGGHGRHRLAASSSDAVAGAAMAAAAAAAAPAATAKPQGQQASSGPASGGKKAGGAFEDSASAWRGRESATSSSDGYTFPNSPNAVRRQLFTDIVRYPKGVELPSKGRGAHTSHYDAGAALAAADGAATGALEGAAPAAAMGGSGDDALPQVAPAADSTKPPEGKAQGPPAERLSAGKGAAAAAADINGTEMAPAAGYAGKQTAVSEAPVSRPKSAAASTRPPSTPAASMARAPSAPVATVRPVSAGAPAMSYAALAGVQGPLQRPTSAGVTAGQRSKQEVAVNRLNVSIQSDRHARAAAVSPTRVNPATRPRSVSPGPPGLHDGCRIFARGGRAVSPGPPQRGVGTVSPGPLQRGARTVSPGPPQRGPGTISPGPPQRGAVLRPQSAGRRALGPGPELEEEIQRQLGRLHRVRQEHWETATRVGAPILRNVSPGRPTGAGDCGATMGGAAAVAGGSPGRVRRQTQAMRPDDHEEQQWRLQQQRARQQQQQQDFDFGESWRSFIERQQVFLEGRALKIQLQRQGWQEEVSAPKICPGSQRILQRQQLQQQRRQQAAQPTTPSSRKPRTPTAAEATQDSTAAPSAATTEGGTSALLRQIDQQLRSPGSSRGGHNLIGDADGDSSSGGSTTPSYGIAATKAAARAASAINAAASSPRGGATIASAAPEPAPVASGDGDKTSEVAAGIAKAEAAAAAAPSFCVGSNPGTSPSSNAPTNPTRGTAHPVSRLRSLLRFGNKPRSVVDMSEGDRVRRERRLAEARAAKEARELDGATFRPKLSAGTASGAYADVRPRLAQLRTDPEGYMAAVAEKQRQMEVKREWAAKEREAAELAECTFSPRTTRSSLSRSVACSSAGASEASWAAAYGAGTGGWARRRPSERAAAAAPGRLVASGGGDGAFEAAAAAAAKSYVLESPQWEKVETELRAMQSRWHAAARQKPHAASGTGPAAQWA